MLILTRELSDNTLSWQQQDLRCQVELISCSSYVCSFGSAALFVPPTNPFVTSCFFSNVQYILFWAFAFSHLYIIFLTHAGCPPAADPSLQELLQPLIHLDRQLQLAASVVDQLKDLEDGLETMQLPMCSLWCVDVSNGLNAAYTKCDCTASSSFTSFQGPCNSPFNGISDHH